ncbi:60S acidic ribosomal protein P1, partial [Perkinsus olseni]
AVPSFCVMAVGVVAALSGLAVVVVADVEGLAVVVVADVEGLAVVAVVDVEGLAAVVVANLVIINVMSDRVVLKLRHRDQVVRRRVEASECMSYPQVLNHVTEAWPQLSGQKFTIYYVDEERDKCMLDERSFADATALVAERGSKCFEFFVESTVGLQTPPRAGSNDTPPSASSRSSPCSIASLKSTPPPKAWTLKARVTATPVIKEFKKGNFEGTYFSVHLHDGQESIKAIFFNKAALRYESILKKNHVYIFSGGAIKPAHEEFNPNSTHELRFNSMNTSVEEAQDHCTMPVPDEHSACQRAARCHLPTLITSDDVKSSRVGSRVSLAGVCIAAEVTNSSPHHSEGETFVLVDEHGAVSLNASSENGITEDTVRDNAVVLLTDARVDNAEESSLGVDSSTVIQIYPSPIIPRVSQLRAWRLGQARAHPYAKNTEQAKPKSSSSSSSSSNSSRYTDEQDLDIFRFMSDEATKAISEGRQVHPRGNKVWERAVERGVAAPHPAQSLRTRWDRYISHRMLEFSQRLADERQNRARVEELEDSQSDSSSNSTHDENAES